MIRVQDLTPSVYYRQSRDFQMLGRLFDFALNSAKTNADMIYDVPASDAAGSKMIDLLSLTLGFNAIHEYNVKQLAAICSILPTILRLKGTQKAIDLICQTALTAEGITAKYWSELTDNNGNVALFIPQALSNVSLIEDLLNYILPAGMTYSVSRSSYNAEPIASTNAAIGTGAKQYVGATSVVRENATQEYIIEEYQALTDGLDDGLDRKSVV